MFVGMNRIQLVMGRSGHIDFSHVILSIIIEGPGSQAFHTDEIAYLSISPHTHPKACM